MIYGLDICSLVSVFENVLKAMSTNYYMSNQVPYTLLLVLPNTRQILLIEDENGLVLPSVKIDRCARPAERLTLLIRQQWAVDALCIEVIVEDNAPMKYAIFEVRTSLSAETCTSLHALEIDSICEDAVPPCVIDALRSLLSGQSLGSGRFSRFGWFREVNDWLLSLISEPNVNISKYDQLNAGGNFALIRLETSGGQAYWLKAVGSPNTREFPITRLLVSSFPSYLPKILGMRDDWNAWIMEEYGKSLHTSVGIEAFERAARKLSSLQHDAVESRELLLNSALRDHRLDILDRHIDAIIAYLDQAMLCQTSLKVDPLSTERLQLIQRFLHNACEEMDTLGIPDSLMHGDISPGSILDDGKNCVFTDWCEAAVGNPFITFELFCVHVLARTNTPRLWRNRLSMVYRTVWCDYLSKTQTDSALHLAQPLAVLSYLYGTGDWLSEVRRFDPEFQSYSRSLGRQLDAMTREEKFGRLL